MLRGMHGFAYLFERFPSYVQAFTHREVGGMIAQGMDPAVFTIRDPEWQRADDFPKGLLERVRVMPTAEELVARTKAMRVADAIPAEIWAVFKGWGDKPDKGRIYEAYHVGLELKRMRVRHVHAHFAGIAARAAWWIKKFFGIGYSFTGHANDIFCEGEHAIGLDDLVRDARMVITVSDYSRSWLSERYPAYARKIFRVYNGIDVARFQADRSRVRPGPPMILSVGRLVEKKGFPDLVEACRILRDRGLDFRCTIAGGGPMEGVIRERIARAELRERVTLTGPVGEKDVIALLSEATIFALACVTEAGAGKDNLPTVIMEAMASGLPVVSTRVAGVPEMLKAPAPGTLTGERKPEELADALAEWLQQGRITAETAAVAQGEAARKFDVSATSRQLKRLLVRCGGARVPAEALARDAGLSLDLAVGIPKRFWGR